MTVATDLAALLLAVCDDPSDLDRRRVYADALEEAGQPDLAYAHRWAVRWRKWPAQWTDTRSWHWLSQTTSAGWSNLPREVFASIPHIGKRTRSWHRNEGGAFRALTAALSKLRSLLSC